MTSSLVGSEMCIRDRGKRQGTSREGSGTGPQEEGKTGESRAFPDKVRGCLLYTSDAADDM
eukprot:2085772-Prorocentrum_lima.AAC.1